MMILQAMCQCVFMWVLLVNTCLCLVNQCKVLVGGHVELGRTCLCHARVW